MPKKKKKKQQQAIRQGKKNQIVIRLEKIDSEKAKAYLEKNLAMTKKGTLGQRHLQRGVWETYKTIMKEGRWKLTHQCIAFDWNGNLIDGQHRLTAVVESGVTIEMFVVRGLDPNVFSLIDAQQTRGFVHLLCNLRSVLGNGNPLRPNVARRTCLVARSMLLDGNPQGKPSDLALAEYTNWHFDNIHSVDTVLGPMDIRPGPVGVSAAFTNVSLSTTRHDDVLALADIWGKEDWRSLSDPLKSGKKKVRSLVYGPKASGRSLPNDIIYGVAAQHLLFALDKQERQKASTLAGGLVFPPDEVERRLRLAKGESLYAPKPRAPKKLRPLKKGRLDMRSTKPTMRTMWITQTMAVRILHECVPQETESIGLAFNQAPHSSRVVDLLARRMSGLDNQPWVVMHQGGLAFDWFGNLIDGKHVLRAIISSGRQQRLFVTTGLDPEIIKVTDQGRKRNAGDFLVCIRGTKDAHALTTGTASRVCKIAKSMLTGPFMKENVKKFSPYTVAQYADRHFSLIWSTDKALGGVSGRRAAGITAAFCNAVVSSGEREKVLAMAERFGTGTFLPGDPLKVARDRIEKLWEDADKGKTHDGKKTVQPDMFYRFLLDALKASLAGRRLKVCEESRVDFTFPEEEQKERK